MSTEEALLGLNKFVCIQGEIPTAQVEWTESNNTDGHVINKVILSDILNNDDGFITTCFECECIASFLTQYLDDHIGENDKYSSFTATGYHLLNSNYLVKKALQCSGIPNWFLSVLIIRNVSESDTGDYKVMVYSNSTLKHASNFTIQTGRL